MSLNFGDAESIREAREVVQALDGSCRFEPVSRARIVKMLAADFGVDHKASIKRAFLKAEADNVLERVKGSFLVAGDASLAEDQEPDRVEREGEDDDDERPFIPPSFAKHGSRPYILHGKMKIPVSEKQWAEWLDDPDCEGAEYGACWFKESIDTLDNSSGCWMHDNFGGGYYGDGDGGELTDCYDCPDCYLADKMREYCDAYLESRT